MTVTRQSRVCAFCGTTGNRDTRYAAGFGVLIDEDCMEFFAGALETARGRDPRRSADGWSVPLRKQQLDSLSDQELLDTLPRISNTAGHVNQFLAEWVELIRERKMSWTIIGNAMGISRQAAWERFTRVLGTTHRAGSR